jgi:hypothetical protein
VECRGNKNVCVATEVSKDIIEAYFMGCFKPLLRKKSNGAISLHQISCVTNHNMDIRCDLVRKKFNKVGAKGCQVLIQYAKKISFVLYNSRLEWMLNFSFLYLQCIFGQINSFYGADNPCPALPDGSQSIVATFMLKRR